MEALTWSVTSKPTTNEDELDPLNRCAIGGTLVPKRSLMDGEDEDGAIIGSIATTLLIIEAVGFLSRHYPQLTPQTQTNLLLCISK